MMEVRVLQIIGFKIPRVDISEEAKLIYHLFLENVGSACSFTQTQNGQVIKEISNLSKVTLFLPELSKFNTETVELAIVAQAMSNVMNMDLGNEEGFSKAMKEHEHKLYF